MKLKNKLIPISTLCNVICFCQNEELSIISFHPVIPSKRKRGNAGNKNQASVFDKMKNKIVNIVGKNSSSFFFQFLKNPHNNMMLKGNIKASIINAISNSENVLKNVSSGAFSMNTVNSANGFPHTNKSGTTNAIDIEMINPSNVVSAFLIFLRNIKARMIPKM